MTTLADLKKMSDSQFASYWYELDDKRQAAEESLEELQAEAEQASLELPNRNIKLGKNRKLLKIEEKEL